MKRTAEISVELAEQPVYLRRGGAKWLAALLAAIVFLGLGLGLVLPRYLTGGAMPGDLGDARFNLAVLESFTRTLHRLFDGRSADFLAAPFFYPWPRVANFSDTFWGDGWVYALARALGTGELGAFRAWVLVGFALTYATTFLSLRKLGLRPWGAAGGAFLFAFPLPMTAQLGHAQLVWRLWVAPAVVALDRLLTRGSWRAGAACLLFLALELVASIYIGLFLCLLLASYAIATAAVARSGVRLPSLAELRSRRLADRAGTAILLLAGLGVLAVVAIPYHEVQAMYGFGRSWPEVASLLPRPGSYLLAGASRIYPDLSSWFAYPAVWEQQLFPGLAPLIALGWFLLSPRARARNPAARVLLTTTGILFMATIDLHGWSFYRLIFPIPGFSAMRAVCRVILVLMLPPAILFGMLTDDLAGSAQRPMLCQSLAVALSILLITECSLVRQDFSAASEWRARAHALEARLPGDLPPDAILAVKSATRHTDITAWTYGQLDAEIVAATLGIRTINGYSGNFPPTWKTPATCRDVGEDLRAGRHFLEEHGQPAPAVRPGQLVLVGYHGCDPAGLGRDPELVLGRPYHFALGGGGNGFIGDGFSDPEAWGRWTDARRAFLFFRLAAVPAGPIVLTLRALSFSAAHDQRQQIAVAANGRSCGRFVLSRTATEARVSCPQGALRAGDNTLLFTIGRPARPIDLGLGTDRRHLGLGLEQLTIAPLN
ncbi:MAG: DUF7024 domain-containing protein [Acetobacteraceae bacterium]